MTRPGSLLQNVTLALVLAWFTGACMDDTLNGRDGARLGDALPERLERPGATPWAIAVVGTDYLSSSISIVDRERQALFRENVVHSGAAAPGLSIALSGDIVLARAPNPHHWIVLLDRYPNSVLTFVSPEDFSVLGQLSVATGFASNPHDFLWLADEKAYVTRFESNPRPGAEPYDEGDDILIVDPLALKIRGRIPLGESVADGDGSVLQARPDQMVWAKGMVFVALNHLNADFTSAGEGRLAAIDPAADAVLFTVSLPGVTNCGGLVYVASRDALYVSCSGLFAPGQRRQNEHSGIVQVDLGGSTPVTRLLRRATDDGGERPYGFDLDVATARWLLAVRFGDLATGAPDRLVAIDLETGGERLVHEAGSPYGLGGVLVDDSTNTVYVGEADPTAPAVRLYHIAQGAFTPAGTLDAHPRVGLPPRHIRFY